MPKNYYEKFAIEIRTNEHNHKRQNAHVHIYVHGQEVATMFLDGTIKDGALSGRDMKRVAQYVKEKADGFQEQWDLYQRSDY
jgi:hypothetical protein